MDQKSLPGEVSRRSFLGSSAAAALAAPFAARAAGANDKIAVGMIGIGIRGSQLLERLYARNKETATVSAICDAYTGNLSKAAARVETLGGNTPKRYADYRELLQDKSIDAVIIATPEHRHAAMLIDALEAGKHVYIEKPLAHTIEEGEKILRAAGNSKQVVQVGTQNRSNSLYVKAKEMVAAGMIGEVHYTRAFWYRNSLDDAPAWRYAIPADATEQNTDWTAFPGERSQTAVQQAPLLSMAALLGLFRRHLHRPAGAPDRYHAIRPGQDGPAFLHGVRSDPAMDPGRPRGARYPERHLRVSRRIPRQL